MMFEKSLSAGSLDQPELPQPAAQSNTSHEEIDKRLEEARKRRRIIQRDLQRLAVKFEDLRTKVFDNKEQMLDEERRLLNQGVHPDLQRQMDEIQQSYDARRSTIDQRFELTKQSLDTDHHFQSQMERHSFYANKAKIRRTLLKQCYSILDRLQRPTDYASLVQKPFRATGRLPDRMDPLNAQEIGNDLNAIAAATTIPTATASH